MVKEIHMIRFDLTVSIVKQFIEENYQLSNLTNDVFKRGTDLLILSRNIIVNMQREI